MHTFTDPADGETYVSAYCGMDVAHRVLACFDQNDLKAPLTPRGQPLTQPGPCSATAGRPPWGRGRWTFSTMPMMPVALFVVCAGPWHSVTLGPRRAALWLARPAVAGRGARPGRPRAAGDHRSGCSTTTRRSSPSPYPFDWCDQIFVPGLNWVPQENPGCVTYRDEMLPRERITDDLRTPSSATWSSPTSRRTCGSATWSRCAGSRTPGCRSRSPTTSATGWPSTSRLRRCVGAPRDRPQTRGVRRRRAPVHAPGRPAGRGRARRQCGADQLRLDLLRQGQLRAAPAGHLAGRRGVPRRRQRPPDPAPLRQRRPSPTSSGSLDGASYCDVREWVRVWLRTSGFDTVRVTRDGDVPGAPPRGDPAAPPHRDGVRRPGCGRWARGWSTWGDDPVPPRRVGLRRGGRAQQPGRDLRSGCGWTSRPGWR